MKTTRQSFQMLAHCLFTSIDSNEKSREIEMRVIKQPRYPNLSKLALACVVLPNSNADSERIFSMLNKIQTEHRSELANDTICSLICAKQNQNMECYEYYPDSEVLKKAKNSLYRL
jgi:hypothetical protein